MGTAMLVPINVDIVLAVVDVLLLAPILHVLRIPGGPGVIEAIVDPEVKAPPWPVIQGIEIIVPGHGLAVMVLLPFVYMTGTDVAATVVDRPLQAAQSSSE